MLDIDLISDPPTPPPPRCIDTKCGNLCGQRGRKRFIASWGLRMSHICPCTPCPSPQGYRSKVESRHFAHHCFREVAWMCEAVVVASASTISSLTKVLLLNRGSFIKRKDITNVDFVLMSFPFINVILIMLKNIYIKTALLSSFITVQLWSKKIIIWHISRVLKHRFVFSLHRIIPTFKDVSSGKSPAECPSRYLETFIEPRNRFRQPM